MAPPARDVGLGTAYERWAIYRRIERWCGTPRTALEGPVDGMAGMPGLHLLPLARRGVTVTVAHPDLAALERVETVYRDAGLGDRLRTHRGRGVPEGPFDLVLAFNFAHLVPDWRAHIGRVASVAADRLIVFATHPASWGVGVRKVLRAFEPSSGPEIFDHESCVPRVMRRELRAHGVIEDERLVDCPWWPDLFVSAGETLAGATAARFAGTPAGPARTPYDFGPADYPFAAATRPGPVRDALRRHPSYEAAPPAVAGLFAHHRAYLLRRPENGSLGRARLL